jgi:hypothetical protein
MIIAIGVYRTNQNNYDKSYDKILFGQQNRGELFPGNKLEKVETHSLRKFSQNLEAQVDYYPYEDEHHYLYKPNLDGNIILAIVSKTPLQALELRYLFTNIEHIRIKPQSVKTTLDDIVKNPLGYTGRDILIQAIKDEADQTVEALQIALDKVIQRGEALKELDTTSLNLRYSAKRFEREASNLNSCCRY